jgi:hypothetical protein
MCATFETLCDSMMMMSLMMMMMVVMMMMMMMMMVIMMMIINREPSESRDCFENCRADEVMMIL